MPAIKLPDGSVRQFDGPVSVGAVAASIGPGLAKAALAGKVDGKVVDTSYVIDRDAALAIVTDKDPKAWTSSGTPPRTCWRMPSRNCFPMRR